MYYYPMLPTRLFTIKMQEFKILTGKWFFTLQLTWSINMTSLTIWSTKVPVSLPRSKSVSQFLTLWFLDLSPTSLKFPMPLGFIPYSTKNELFGSFLQMVLLFNTAELPTIKQIHFPQSKIFLFQIYHLILKWRIILNWCIIKRKQYWQMFDLLQQYHKE